MDTTAFNTLINAVSPTSAAGTYLARMTEDWLQGRAAFGGITSAMAVAALRQEIQNDRPLRALMIAFIGPVAAGDLRATSEW